MYRSKTGKEVRIGMDNPTNALIIVASPGDLSVIEKLVEELEKLPRKGQKQDGARK